MTDLRIRKLVQEPVGPSPKTTISRDLKETQILKPYSLGIRDTDWINNPVLQALFLHDEDGFRDLLRHLLVRVLLRSDVLTLGGLNRKQREDRANPAMFAQAESFCHQFDEFIRKHDIETVQYELQSVSDIFRRGLDLVCERDDILFDRDQRARLRGIYQPAIDRRGILMFGKFFRRIEQQKNAQLREKFIEVCRAAYAAPFVARGESPVLTTGDINLEWLRAIQTGLGLTITQDKSDSLFERHSRLIADGTLDRISFSNLRDCRVVAEDTGYFEACRGVEGFRGIVNLEMDGGARRAVIELYRTFHTYLEAINLPLCFAFSDDGQRVLREAKNRAHGTCVVAPFVAAAVLLIAVQPSIVGVVLGDDFILRGDSLERFGYFGATVASGLAVLAQIREREFSRLLGD